MKKVFKEEGFTLIELLVVVAIIGILAAIAIPQFAEYRARGFDSRSVSDLRNAATAEEAYFADAEAYLTCSVTGSSGGPNNCGVLPAFSASIGVTVDMVDAATSPPSFTGEAFHTSGTRLAANPYQWDSNQGGLQ